MVIILNKVSKIYFNFASIRWKLLFTYLLISLVPLFFFTNSVSSKIEDYVIDRNGKELKSFANRVAGQIARANYLFDETLRMKFDNDIEGYAKEMPVRIIVVDSKAVVANDSSMVETGKVFLAPEILDALNKKNVAVVQNEEANMVVAVAVVDDNANVIGAVYVVASMESENEMLSDITGQLISLVILISVIIVVLVIFVSQLLLDPLRNIMRVVKRMSEGHLNQRIPVSGHDEFSELAEAFNDMTEQLDRVETTRQEFVSNVSHELKTPLSSIKVLSESLLFQEEVTGDTYREFLQDINSEIDRMSNIVDELLVLVRLEQTEQPLNIAPFKANKMVEDILKRLYPLAEQKNIELLFEDVRPVSIDGDEMKLSLAVSNLVENGIKYTNEGGTVKVIADCDHQHAFITVQDTGIGISEEEQSKVFARFYRIDKTRDRHTGGTGLGLAITHKTVLLHNGSIKLMSKEGEGSSFVVRIPLRQAANQNVQ